MERKYSNSLFHFQYLKELDFWLISLCSVIALIGFLMLYSAGGGSFSPWSSSQMARFILFIPLFLIIAATNLKLIHRFAYLFYFIGLAFLIYANFAGFSAMGAKRWVNLGFINFQPSEFMKIALIIALSRYFHNTHTHNVKKIWYLVFPILITIIPVILIMRQPDLGTSLILLATAIVIFFIAGVGVNKFITVGVAAIATIPLLWNSLKAYQKQRILTFLNPESDPLGSGYNIIQSKIAIGSGGFTGKGLLSGSQGQLNFLPERETDFIFTMVAEEFGFLGCFIIISLYCLIFYRIASIAIDSKSYFGRFLSVGLGFFLFMHFFINIAMITGLIPVVGAPLPLISYGGTMLIITLVSFALILNVDLHRDLHIPKVN